MRAALILTLAAGAQAWAHQAAADTAQILGQAGSWGYFVATDPMNDKQWYGALTKTEGVSLQVSCQPHNPTALNVSFSTKQFLGSGYRDVTYRVDSLPSHTDTAVFSNKDFLLLCEGACRGNGASSSPNERLIGQVKTGTQLLTQMRTHSGETVEFLFPVDGAAEAFTQVTEGCLRLNPSMKKRQLTK